MATCLVNPKANGRSFDMSRFPHACSNFEGVLRQAGARKNLHVVVSSLVTWSRRELSLWMKEGKEQNAERTTGVQKQN